MKTSKHKNKVKQNKIYQKNKMKHKDMGKKYEA